MQTPQQTISDDCRKRQMSKLSRCSLDPGADEVRMRLLLVGSDRGGRLH